MIRLCHIFIGLFVACVAAHAQPVFKGGVTNGSSTTTGATGQTWAVIVGISNYQFVDKLRYADKDAEVFYQFLSSPAGGSVPLSNMTLLLNENATTHQIDKTLHNLVDLVKPGDRVVIYFSGHGDQEVITMEW